MNKLFPRFTREQNRACKLSSEDLIEIREMLDNGESKSSIADYFGVNWATIHYWSKTDEERKEYSRKVYETKDKKYNSNPEKLKKERERKRRKKELFPDEFREYNNFSIQKWRKKYPKKAIHHAKLYSDRHPDRISKTKKDYYEKNKERIADYYNKNRESIRKKQAEYYKL